MAVSLFTVLYNHQSLPSISRTCSHPKQKLCSSNKDFPPPFPQPLVTSILASVSRNLSALGNSEKWNHTAFVLLCLAFSVFSRLVHGVASVRISFPFMAEEYSPFPLCEHHILFIHSSVDGHLGGFCLWDIVNNVLMNMGVYMYLSKSLLSVLRGICLRSGIARSQGNFVFNFVRNYQTFPPRAHIPTGSAPYYFF